MPKSLRVFTVFVASPSDVAPERDCIEEVIQQLNEVWERRLGIRLDLWRWETSAYPGFGADGQDVINDQSPDEFDVFIGVLWSRLGTATGRAESGTVEEFNRAYTQWDRDPSSIKLLLYFKQAAVEMDSIDTDQIKAVREFKKSLPPRGGLYWDFASAEDFADLLRKHLQLAVLDLNDQDGSSPSAAVVPSEPDLSNQGEDEDEGMLDLVDEWEVRIEAATTIITRLAESVATVGQAVTQGTAQLTELGSADTGQKRKIAQRVIANMANRLDAYSSVVELDSPALKAALHEAVGVLDKAVQIAPDFGEGAIQSVLEVRAELVVFEKSMREGRAKTAEMAEIIDSIPRISTVFNRARRRAVSGLKGLVATLDTAGGQLLSSIKLIDRLEQG